MKYTGRRRREARREAGCYLRWEGGAGCRVYGVAQSTTAEPRRSLDSAISERAAPLQEPQLANACAASFGPAAQRQRRRGRGRACRPVGAATVVAGVRPRRGSPCAAPPGGGPGAPALPVHPPNGAPATGSWTCLIWVYGSTWYRPRMQRARPSKEEPDGRAHRGRASLP
jgi:hypothetical protein